MGASLKTWSLRIFKIAIAVLGLWWVISHTPWEDTATVDAGPTKMTSIRGADLLEPMPVYVLNKPVTRPGNLFVRFTDAPVSYAVNGEKFHKPFRAPVPGGGETDQLELPKSYFVTAENTGEPKIQIGLKHLVLRANPWLLLAAWAVLGLPFLITAWRWKLLMEPQGIHLPYSKCLALTFVGQFYSTFLPGITGGDLVKIIYTSRVTGSKTKSTITILLDRVLGLLALLVIAGAAAASQSKDPTMRNIAVLIGAVLLGVVVGTGLYFSQRVRRMLGIDRLTEGARQRAAAREAGLAEPTAGLGGKMRRLAEWVVQADESLHRYRHHAGILLVAFGVSVVTQLISPLSAYLAGMAFGMQAHFGYYLAYVPLALLAASVPIAPPAGFGVTEYVLFHFFHKRPPYASPGQTFVLAQAIRFLPIAWNLIGAFWVVTGTYTRHEAEQEAARA